MFLGIRRGGELSFHRWGRAEVVQRQLVPRDDICRALAYCSHDQRSAKLGAAGACSTKNTRLIEDLVGCAPITIKQRVEDFKATLR
jgi:hypothetical protein